MCIPILLSEHAQNSVSHFPKMQISETSNECNFVYKIEKGHDTEKIVYKSN